MSTDDGQKLLCAREAAEYLGIPLASLYTIERNEELIPFRTPGGHRRYPLYMLNQYLEETKFRTHKYPSD